MSSTFDKAFNLLIRFEGGYVNDPDDPGSETKFGISKRRYPNLDIKNLTIEQAKEIYKRDYWDKFNGDNLPPRVAIFLLQCAVNIGLKRSCILLQSATRRLLHSKLKLDGIIGPKTIAAVKQVPETQLLNELAIRQLLRYFRICHQINPKLSKFIRGWYRRVVYSLQYVMTVDA